MAERNDVAEMTCEISFRPTVLADAGFSGGNVVIGMEDNMPGPETVGRDGWMYSGKLLFTDGRDIFVGYLRFPGCEMVELGHVPEFETVHGKSFSTKEVKGWRKWKSVRITISR